MFSTRNISRTLLASAYSLALFAVTCIAFVAGDLSAQTVSRGPYLQLGTPSSVIVRWRTDIATTARVQYGNDAGNLNSVADSPVNSTDHEVTLTGLAADTRYYYSVGTPSTVLASGPDHKFVTSPPAGASKPMRIWVIGDAGTGTSSQISVRNAYSAFNSRETDLWLVLGDNAYDVGSDAEYQAKHFAIYPNMLRSSVSWYTLGNHDAGTGSVGAHPYHTMFSFPTAGEAGGWLSGTKSYYSFNYGNVHFISLDSHESNRATNGSMATWLQLDLQNNTLPWVIAFWHHPPYSKGSHDSDTETNLVQMRSNFLPILEQHGVDLVLSGHSHSYERSYLLDGHYGVSSTLQPGMKKNAGDGRPAGTGAYEKPSIGPSPHEGAVYVVAGSSGQTSGFKPDAPHPAMYISLNNLGSLVLDLNGETLNASFLRENGAIADTFTLIKGSVSGNLPPDASITSPVNGASFTTPSSITLTANASDEDSVSQVEFYNGATSLGMASPPSPYSMTWNNPPAGNHRLTARATDNNGAIHISAPVFITVNAPATAPADPTNLAPGTVTISAVPLTWSDNATNETGFEIERAIGAGGFSLLTTKAANTTSHTDTSVSPSTSYSYRVRATNGVGPSGYSNTVTVTTPDAPPPPPPAAPSNLQKSSVTATQVALKWTDKATNETSYQVERATGTGSFAPLTTLGANAISYTDATVAPVTKYSYRVRAVNAGGNSAYSNTLTVTTPDVPPGAPSGLSATAVAARQINLQWTDGANNETGFEIERSTDGTKFGRIKTVGVNVTTYANTGLTANKTYWYRVRAINKAGASAYSDTASAVTPLQ